MLMLIDPLTAFGGAPLGLKGSHHTKRLPLFTKEPDNQKGSPYL